MPTLAEQLRERVARSLAEADQISFDRRSAGAQEALRILADAAIALVLEEAAKTIERKHTNNVGMVHPMAIDDAKAIRSLAKQSSQGPTP